MLFSLNTVSVLSGRVLKIFSYISKLNTNKFVKSENFKYTLPSSLHGLALSFMLNSLFIFITQSTFENLFLFYIIVIHYYFIYRVPTNMPKHRNYILILTVMSTGAMSWHKCCRKSFVLHFVHGHSLQHSL